MLCLFMWDRWRYDVVAALTLFAAIGVGVVKPTHAFEGFSNSVIIVIASVLVVSKAIARSGALDAPVAALLRSAQTKDARIGLLAACVGFLSAFLKNVGTLGIFMPLAIKTARRNLESPSLYLMPLSFASLLGGAMTLVGTSPNLLISAIREVETGRPFQLFDYAWVGLPLTLIALVFLAFGWRLLPHDRSPGPNDEDKFEIERYMTELRVEADSALAGKTVGDVEDLVEGDLIVTAIERNDRRSNIPSRRRPLFEGDLLIVKASSDIVRSVIDKGGLVLEPASKPGGEGEHSELEAVEAIVGAESVLIGASAEDLRLRHNHEVNLLAVSRAGKLVTCRLRSHKFAVGDVVVLQASPTTLQTALGDLGCLPLADRNIGLGKRRHAVVSVAILAIAILTIVTHILPVEAGFFGAALFVVLTKQISLKTAYNAIEGPVLVMLGCLISFAEGLKETGVTTLLAQHLAAIATQLPGALSLTMILVVTMIATPVLHHAPAVLVIGPLAAELAKTLGYNPDPFLMAVALGAACDFLTPIGHQNNLLVMGPGGYRFGDYWRLGLPLSMLVVLVGSPLILFFWPL